MSDEQGTPEGGDPRLKLTPAQRLENLEYLAFRMFMQNTELPPPPDAAAEAGIVTLDSLEKPAQQATPFVNVPYDMAYARAGVEQILQSVPEDRVWVPGMIHAIRAGMQRFNQQAEEEARKQQEAEEEG